MAPLELHVDLGKGVAIAVAQSHQSVVAPDQPEDQKEDDRAEHDENNPVCPQRRQIAKKRFNHDTM